MAAALPQESLSRGNHGRSVDTLSSSNRGRSHGRSVDTLSSSNRGHSGSKDPVPRVGFLLTEVDAERDTERSQARGHSSEQPRTASDGGGTTGGLPPLCAFRVEEAELPKEALDDNCRKAAPLPSSIPMDKVMLNIVQNLDVKAWSEQARNSWFRDFRSKPSRFVICDTFWYCICWYFKPEQHGDAERRLFDRISASFVALFTSIAPARKDMFFGCYADAVAQAVLYALFLAYPKSRASFGDRFRRDLVIRISHWTTGVKPEFVKTTHWKLNLGGGDVLQATASSLGARAASGGIGSLPPAVFNVTADALSTMRGSLAHRPPRPKRTLRYSLLVGHFLRTRHYSSVNFVPPTVMGLTTAEERSRLMDVKHAKLVERATAARENCDRLVADYQDLVTEVRRQERQRQAQAAAAKKNLESRRKEVLRSDPHEYANYLVSLHLLQQGMGQNN